MKTKKNSFLKKIKSIIAIILLILITTCGFIIKSGYDLYKEVTHKADLSQKIEELKKIKNYTPISDIPILYKKSVVVVEDKRFFEHAGIDIIRLGRAIINDISTKSLNEGASTITQQVAKNFYFNNEKKFARKVAELFVAKELENNYSKDEILEFYLNIIYYGDGYYGIGNASKGYFNKSPKDMSIYEQTLLVGIPNAPSVYALSNNSNLTIQRQNIVLSLLKDENILSNNEILKIKEQQNLQN